MDGFSPQVPSGRGIEKERVGTVYLNALVRVFEMKSTGNVFLYDFGIPAGTNGTTWEPVGANYNWWREIFDRQIIIKRDKNHTGKIFYDEEIDPKLGGGKQILG